MDSRARRVRPFHHTPGIALLCLFVAIVSVASGCGGGGAPRPARTPNVILVTVDTLRADHLEAYGYGRETSPELTRLAADGVRFGHAVAQAPWTLPSLASIHTSLYPLQHGATDSERATPEEAETLAEVLQAAGYRTVGVISHEFASREYGQAQGFEVFDETNIISPDELSSEGLTETALEHLEGVTEPFFLWVHYFDPHYTYLRHPDVGFADGYSGGLPDNLTSDSLSELANAPVSDADLDYIEAVYDEEIAHTASQVGSLWDAVTSRYGADSSVLILTADHGEYFLEHGRFLHGKDVYEELVHVPLLIAGAIDEDLRGQVVDETVAALDIPATVMGLLGIGNHPFAGQDLMEIARGGEAAPVFTEGSWAFGDSERKRAVIHNGWKLIHRLDDDGYELYERATDPAERYDRYELESTLENGAVRFLLRQLDEFAELPRLTPQAVNISPDALKRLRGLGYIR